MTAQRPRILVVDDEPAIRNLVQEILSEEGYDVMVAQDAASARAHRQSRKPDLILLDIWMPGEDGVSLLKDWQKNGGLSCPVVMMSGHGTVETAVEATKLGAFDFIEKPLTLAKLLTTVRRALDTEQQRATSRAEPTVTLVGTSEAIGKLREHASRIAQHDSWVLITGEAGVGKETVARYVHTFSARRDYRFIGVSGAALARGDAAQVLFGSEKSGMTKPGLFEEANHGTLYLENIAQLDAETQTLLQEALEAQSFRRIGGTKQLGIDVRIIAACDHELSQDVRVGHFREDLFYRLNMLPLQVPPLRDHPEDVPELINFFVDYYCAQEGLPYRRFSIPAQNRLRHYPWPGNVQELKNLVQRLLILSSSEEIGADEVEAQLKAGEQPSVRSWDSELFDLPLREAREAFERNYLLHQLKQARGNISKLAERIGMERTHLYRKMKSLGINPKQIE